MHAKTVLGSLAMATALAATGCTKDAEHAHGAPAAPAAHDHGAAPPAQLALKDGKKWPTDEPLHVVLMQLFAATGAMKGEGDRTAGALQAISALDAYGKHFEHAGWQPISH